MSTLPAVLLLSAALLAGWVQPSASLAAGPTTEASSVAQPSGTLPRPIQPTLVAQTRNGKTVDLQTLRGQVVLVMVWSTNCAVCLDKMPEMRANLMGWASQGFQIVSINTDQRLDNLAQWETVRQATLPAKSHWPSVWAYSPGFSTSLPLVVKATATQPATQLPAFFVMDRLGNLRYQATGRLPAEVWDTIAELL